FLPMVKARYASASDVAVVVVTHLDGVAGSLQAGHGGHLEVIADWKRRGRRVDDGREVDFEESIFKLCIGVRVPDATLEVARGFKKVATGQSLIALVGTVGEGLDCIGARFAARVRSGDRVPEFAQEFAQLVLVELERRGGFGWEFNLAAERLERQSPVRLELGDEGGRIVQLSGQVTF